MSYLSFPRLIFTGDFLSDVSTVNNDTAHYNNATFRPNFQEPAAPSQLSSNGWWNPEGGAVFNFENCIVQQVTMQDGSVLADSSSEPVLGQIVGGVEGRPTGKMVDLDPDMQMVTGLWCVQVRIYTSQNEMLLQGDLNTTCFRDLQFRQLDGGKKNGQPRGSTWTSVLTNIVWGDQSPASPFLSQLRAITQGNKLSINLNAFGYYYNKSLDGRFSMGRIIGSIGPWFYGEPDTFVLGRRLYGIIKKTKKSHTYFAISNFIVEQANKRLTIDFGSSYPITAPLGRINPMPILLAVSKKPVSTVPSEVTYASAEDFIQIGTIPYNTNTAPDWLNRTGGIVSFTNLSADIIEALSNNQLLLLMPSRANPAQFAIVAREAVNGLLVRADNFVQRLDAGDTNTVNFYAAQWGKPLKNNTITLTLAPPTPDTPLGPNSPISELYGNNFPADGLSFPAVIHTDNNGFALLSINGNAIQSPRVYLDGQVYTINYQLQQIPNDYDNFAITPDIIAVHLRDAFEILQNPVWEDIAPTMIQYSNLYPIMSKYLVNLADPVALKSRKDILIFAFSRDINDTMHMPVTRDLSKAKRQTILNWLNSSGIAVEAIPKSFSESIGQSKPKHQNPVPASTPLTDVQLKFRNATKAKNGATRSLPDDSDLFENI